MRDNQKNSSLFSRIRHIPYFNRTTAVPKLSPVPVLSSIDERRRLASQYQESWWVYTCNWIRYYMQQWHWDIERACARLLRRRWTDFHL